MKVMCWGVKCQVFGPLPLAALRVLCVPQMRSPYGEECQASGVRGLGVERRAGEAMLRPYVI